MTVEETDVIDAIGTDNSTLEVVLTIFDHLPWSGDHVRLLSEKIATYANFVKGGGLLKDCGIASGAPIKILVLLKFRPNGEAEQFLRHVRSMVLAEDWKFSYQPIPSLGYAEDPSMQQGL